MANTVSWGILGPGNIAHKFVKGLLTVDSAHITAVGSRDGKKSEAFSKEYGIEKSYGSYEELVQDPEIDIIYVATPHPFHYECSKLCLNAGKAVLCEKPFTINARDTRKLVELARQKNLFLMEAMWTRFFPVIKKVNSWLRDGVIGDIQMIKADFGYGGEHDPNSRILNLELGGGALLDIGIYPVSFASMIYGSQPKEIKSLVDIGPTGVDEKGTMLFGYEKGQIACLSSAVKVDLVNDAWIFGTKGSIYIKTFYKPDEAVLTLSSGQTEVYKAPYESTGYQFEALEAINCIRQGKTECDVMPLDESIAIMETMDRIRAQWQLRYPGE